MTGHWPFASVLFSKLLYFHNTSVDTLAYFAAPAEEKFVLRDSKSAYF